MAPSFVWSKNINKANFQNELLLTEIAMLIAISEKQKRSVPELKQNHRIGSFFCSVVISLFFLMTVTQLNAVPVLTQSFLTSGSVGVVTGSFDGGGGGLNDLLDLADSSAEPREYISQHFKPVISGSYVFGLSSSNEDTVLILYDGEFDETQPQSRALDLDDDSDGAGAGGVIMATCGSTARLCPKISANLTGGKIYSIVVTSYLPASSVSDGVNFYIYGEPVLVGTGMQEEASVYLAQIIRSQAQQILSNLLNIEDEFTNSAISRHVSAQAKAGMDSLETEKEVTKNVPPQRISQINASASDDLFRSNVHLQNSFVLNNDSKLILQSSGSYAKSRRGIASKHVNVRAAVEHFDQRTGTLGVSIGANFSKSNLVLPKPSSSQNRLLFTSLYGIKTFRKDFFVESHATIGMGSGDSSYIAGLEQWRSQHKSRVFLAGLTTSGVINVKRYAANGQRYNFEIWPTLSIQYGFLKTKDIKANFTYGSIFENIAVTGEGVKITKATLAPKFKFDLLAYNHFLAADRFTIEPSLICTRVKAQTDQNGCGVGLGFALEQKKTGHQNFRFQLQNTNDEKNWSASAIFSLRF